MQERKDFELSNEITVVDMTLIQNMCVWHRLNKAHSICSF